MKSIFSATLVAMLLIGTPDAFSQGQSGGHVGGGDPTAVELQTMISQLDRYLLSTEGQKAYPKIPQPGFHEIVQLTKPVVKDERVYDSFKVAQTCISVNSPQQRYFQCDLKRLPPINNDSLPSYYRLVFHELLFQIGMELPISRDVPSNFEISSTLEVHVVNGEWRIGRNTPDEILIPYNDRECHSAEVLNRSIPSTNTRAQLVGKCDWEKKTTSLQIRSLPKPGGRFEWVVKTISIQEYGDFEAFFLQANQATQLNTRFSVRWIQTSEYRGDLSISLTVDP